MTEPLIDNDTWQYGGTAGPFKPWEHDHTALVHVLWAAKHEGWTLQDDCDKIAGLILRSRWLAAQIARGQ